MLLDINTFRICWYDDVARTTVTTRIIMILKIRDFTTNILLVFTRITISKNFFRAQWKKLFTAQDNTKGFLPCLWKEIMTDRRDGPSNRPTSRRVHKVVTLPRKWGTTRNDDILYKRIRYLSFWLHYYNPSSSEERDRGRGRFKWDRTISCQFITSLMLTVKGE